MKSQYAVALSVLVGFAAGAAAVQGLHAQAKPHAYALVAIDIQKPDEYARDFQPHVLKAIRDGGGKFLAASDKVVPIHGSPPSRGVLIEFENMDKAQATYDSAAYKDAQKIGEKYATFRIFLVEAVSP